MNPEGSWDEAEFRRNVLDKCNGLDLLVNYHQIDSLSPLKGWPDLEIVGRYGILYRELKTMTGVLSVQQRRIGSKLAMAGANWSIWRPVDWRAGIIEQQLTRIRMAHGET